MSVIFSKDKTIELFEALFQAGYEVEMFKVYEYDCCFLVIKLQISHIRNKRLNELVNALSSAGYEIEELNPVCEDHFNGLEITISQSQNPGYHVNLRCYLNKIKAKV